MASTISQLAIAINEKEERIDNTTVRNLYLENLSLIKTFRIINLHRFYITVFNIA